MQSNEVILSPFVLYYITHYTKGQCFESVDCGVKVKWHSQWFCGTRIKKGQISVRIAMYFKTSCDTILDDVE